MRIKRIFNSTFHIDKDESEFYGNKVKKEKDIVANTNINDCRSICSTVLFAYRKSGLRN